MENPDEHGCSKLNLYLMLVTNVNLACYVKPNLERCCGADSKLLYCKAVLNRVVGVCRLRSYLLFCYNTSFAVFCIFGGPVLLYCCYQHQVYSIPLCFALLCGLKGYYMLGNGTY